MSTDEAAVETETVTTVIAPAPVAAPLPEPPKNITARNPLCTVGRRKAAQARARIHPGEGKVSVNGRTLENYFSLEVDRTTALRPFALTGALKKYDLKVNVVGGGATGQADAIALAVARAIAILEPVTHRQMRDSGLLTRDARVKERKKYGRRGARRGFQFSKR
jgi:small subunit ribosomal protein S9